MGKIKKKKGYVTDVITDMFITGWKSGIWTWSGSPENFICLEPWFGIDSTKGDSPEWEKKERLIHLEAGKTFEASYFLEFE